MTARTESPARPRVRVLQRNETTVPLAERGRMLYAEDVQRMFGTVTTGEGAARKEKPRRSLWWVRNMFAPDDRQYLGRTPFWWENDAVRWIDQQAKGAK